MSISDQHCQNRCQFYPTTAECSSGVPSGSNYSWSSHGANGTTNGGLMQKQCSGGGSASCSPVTTNFSPTSYYENQGIVEVPLQRRFIQAGLLLCRVLLHN